MLAMVHYKYTSLDCTPVIVYVPQHLVIPFCLLIKQLKIVTLGPLCFESTLIPSLTTNGSLLGLSRMRV